MNVCIKSIEDLIDANQGKFLNISIRDKKRLLTNYAFVDKIKYCETVEEVIKTILKDAYGIITDNLFETDFDTKFASTLCYYLLGVLGAYQAMSIIWYSEDVDIPVFERGEKGNIDRFITNDNINYLQIFRILLLELKRDCYRMEGYNLEDETLLKLKYKGE